MSVVCVVQARLGSQRLPGKVLMDLHGRPVIAHVMERAEAIHGVDQVVLAVPATDRELVAWAEANRVTVYPSMTHENDVLTRIFFSAYEHAARWVVRVTADCPALAPEVCSEVIRTVLDRHEPYDGPIDYVGNTRVMGRAMVASASLRTCSHFQWPDGLDTEVMSMGALMRAWREATDPYDREHVGTYLWRQPERFGVWYIPAPEDWTARKYSVDTQEDLDWLRHVWRHREDPKDLSWDATRRAADATVMCGGC